MTPEAKVGLRRRISRLLTATPCECPGETPTGPSWLTNLPSEIRLQIWRLLFRHPTGEIYLTRGQGVTTLPVQILQTCRQFHDEIVAVMYSENVVRVVGPDMRMGDWGPYQKFYDDFLQDRDPWIMFSVPLPDFLGRRVSPDGSSVSWCPPSPRFYARAIREVQRTYQTRLMIKLNACTGKVNRLPLVKRLRMPYSPFSLLTDVAYDFDVGISTAAFHTTLQAMFELPRMMSFRLVMDRMHWRYWDRALKKTEEWMLSAQKHPKIYSSLQSLCVIVRTRETDNIWNPDDMTLESYYETTAKHDPPQWRFKPALQHFSIYLILPASYTSEITQHLCTEYTEWKCVTRIHPSYQVNCILAWKPLIGKGAQMSLGQRSTGRHHSKPEFPFLVPEM